MASPQSPSKLSAPIDQALVRRLFADPAKISRADFLRREIAQRMHERLQVIKIVPRHVLDAGCGSGADLPTLQERFPAAHLLALDGSEPMLQSIPAPRKTLFDKLLPSKAGLDKLCADLGNLPLAQNSLDLIWSNLALHWHPQPDRVFAEWRRVLRVEGLLMFSTFGPDTLREVAAAFGELDGTPHTLPFVDMHDFGDQLVEAGFSTPVMDMEKLTVTYDSSQALLQDVQALGGNPLATRRRGLIGKDAWKKMEHALDNQRRPDGKLHLTFEIVYGHAFRPAPRTTASGEAIIRFQPRKPQ